MAANPLTETELAAYCRRRAVYLTIWESDLLFRVDDAVLSVWAAEAKANKPGGEPVPVTDTAGVRAVFMNKSIIKSE